MSRTDLPHPDRRQVLASAAALGLAGLAPLPLSAQAFPAFAQAVAEGVAGDRGLSEFYRETGYAAVFTGPDHAVRRSALISALARADEHGLPVARYQIDELIAAFHRVGSERERGLLEARTALILARYARDVSSGLLEPGPLINRIVRSLPRPDTAALMRRFTTGEPVRELRRLVPVAPEYARLHRAKHDLERLMAQGGWGPQVQGGAIRPGESGAQVVALRNRLIAMGYMPRTASARYDSTMQRGVQDFQLAHGLEPDGIASTATLQAVNIDPDARLRAVMVALERERWLNIPRGKRHIWVNLTAFNAQIVDDDRVTFETRAVIGAMAPDMQTHEFSHRMTMIEINPDWTLPRSIVARRFWNGLQNGRHPYLQIIDSHGRVVPRHEVDFWRFNPRNFPFDVRQPPGPTNPLGRVKFMFPNPWSILLHDSPARSLFQTEVRTHSSGCVRLNDPDEFAYILLARQEADPVEFYQRILRSGQQTRVFLDDPVPIHIDYRTAFTSVDGRLNFRNDVYGRDAILYRALVQAGVVSPAQGA